MSVHVGGKPHVTVGCGETVIGQWQSTAGLSCRYIHNQ